MSQERQRQIAQCFFDAGNSMWYLMRAGLEINAATTACPHKSEQKACAVDVTGVIASFVNAGSFLAFTVTSCPPGHNVQAACASDILKLIGAVAELATASAGIADECVPGEGDNGTVFRRLRHSSRPDTEHREPAMIAECVVDTSQATFFLGRAGTEITASTRSCPNPEEQAACAAEVAGAFTSFAYVGSFLASAASECSGGLVDENALCASDIIKLVSGLSEVASAASGMSITCKPEALAQGSDTELHGDRRLLQDEAFLRRNNTAMMVGAASATR